MKENLPKNFLNVVKYLHHNGTFWRYQKNNLDFTIGHYATRIENKFYTSWREDHECKLYYMGEVDFIPEFQSVIHFHCPAITEDFSHDIPNFQCEYLFNHGPHLSFNENTPSDLIIKFIDEKFNLNERTTAL